MRGSKQPSNLKEQALALLATNTVTEVAKQLNLPRSTVSGWSQSMGINDDPELVKLRQEKKVQFVKDAWGIIEDANRLLSIKVKRALQNEEELNAILEEMEDTVDWNDKKEKAKRLKVANKIETLKIENLSNLSTIIGTLYDKQALINRESTENLGLSEETVEDVLKKLNGEEF